MHTQSSLTLTGQFLVNGTKCQVLLDGEQLTWWPASQSTPDSDHTKEIQIAQMIEVKSKTKTSQNRADEATPIKLNKLKLYYAKQNLNKSTGRLLKLKKLYIVESQTIPAPISAHHDGQQLSAKWNKNEEREPRTSCYTSEGSSSHLSGLSASAGSSSSNSSSSPSPTNDLTSDEANTTTATKQAYTTNLDQNSSTIATLDRLNKMIEDALALERKRRPKRLLVFVNPFGGKGKARQIYKAQVKRLLELAHVEAKLVVTKYANHARDTIEDPLFNLEQFDGIICVGGDGMFSELMNGLLFRFNREKILTATLKRLSISTMIPSSETTATSHHHDNKNNGNIPPEPVQPTSLSVGHHDASSSSSSYSSFSSTSGQQILDAHNLTTLDHHLNDNNNTTVNINDKQPISNLRAALGGIGQSFMTPPLPLGVIGAGSTDANSFGLIGTNDVITATLNIILGKQIRIDVCSVHSIQEDRLLRFVSTFVAYGYFGDVIRESEKLRWLGPSRYDVTGLNNLIKNRAYKGVVRILTSSEDGTPLNHRERCHANCELCLKSKQIDISSANFKLVEKKGSFVGVNAAVTACRCPQTKKGFSPSNHLANGCVDLILVRPCSRLQYLQYLLRTGWTKKSAFDLKYVEAFRCRQFEFLAERVLTTSGGEEDIDPSLKSNSAGSSAASTSSGNSHSSNSSSLDSKQSNSSGSIASKFSSWNVDGEILNEQSIRVKVNNQLLRVFGTGEPIYV